MVFRDDDDSRGISGKRKKSWRELDAQRGKSKYHSRQDDPQQKRIERSTSYAKYKHAADALFTGGQLPENLAASFDPHGKRKAHKDAIRHILEAPGRQAWVERVKEYVESNPDLTCDPFFLDSLLDHPTDRIVDKALSKLEALERDGALMKNKAPPSLRQRLRSLEMTNLDTDIQARAKALQTRLF